MVKQRPWFAVCALEKVMGINKECDVGVVVRSDAQNLNQTAYCRLKRIKIHGGDYDALAARRQFDGFSERFKIGQAA